MDYPEFAEFLVEIATGLIAFNPDLMLKIFLMIAEVKKPKVNL
jgi:hypothetical protein